MAFTQELRLLIDAKSDVAPLVQLKTALANVVAEQQKLYVAGKNNTSEFENNKRKIDDIRNAIRDLNDVSKKSSTLKPNAPAVDTTSINALKSQIKYFRDLRDSASITSPEFVRLTGHVRDLESQFFNLQRQINPRRLSIFQIAEFAENITTVTAGLVIAGQRMAQFTNTFLTSANELEMANKKLLASSKLTGQSFQTMSDTAQSVKSEFKLATKDANEFTIAMTKLGSKAGTTDQIRESISALLNLGAGQGLTVEKTLVAVNQAILGIDEGTDKLFQKNPSVIYEEFANKIGTTAGKLDDSQKALALFNAVLDAGKKLPDEYARYLESFAGKQELLKTKISESKAEFGRFMQFALEPLLNMLVKADDKTRVFAGGVLTVGTYAGQVIPILGGLRMAFLGVNASAVAGILAIGGWITLAGALIGLFAVIQDLVSNPLETAGKLVLLGERLKNFWNDAQNVFSNAKQSIVDFKTATDQTGTTATNTMSDVGDATKKASNTIGNEIGKVTTELTNMQSKLSDLQKQLSTVETGTIIWSKIQTDIAETTRQIEILTMKISDLQKITSTPADVSSGTRDALSETVLPLDVEFRLMIEQQKRLLENRKIVESTYNSAVSSIQTIMSALNVGADTFGGKFLDYLNRGMSILNAITQVLSLFQLIGNVGSGGFLSLFSGILGGGNSPAPLPSIGNIVNSANYRATNGAVNVYINSQIDGVKFFRSYLPVYHNHQNLIRV